MLIIKTLKLMIVCEEFEKLLYRHPEVFFIYLILHLLSPEGPPWLELRRQDHFFVFSSHLES